MFHAIPIIFRNKLMIEIGTKIPERFLNLCAQNEIEIYHLRKTKDGYVGYFLGFCEDIVRSLAVKADIPIVIHQREGIIYRFLLYRLRIAFILTPLLMVGYLSYLTGFIWRIDITGNYQITNDMLYHYLDTIDCGYGASKNSINLENLEFSLRNEFHQIIWVNVLIKGTCLCIEVKENESARMQTSEEYRYGSDLVATRDGTILSMMVRSGTPQHRIGDAVCKGEELVLGSIPIYNNSDNTMIDDTQFVTSDADILLLSEITCIWYEPKLYENEVPYNFKHNISYLRIEGNTLNLPIWGYCNENKQCIENCYQLSILDEYFLPICYGQMCTFQMNETYEFRDMETRRENLIIQMNQYKYKLENNSIEVVSEQMHFLEQPDGTYLMGTIQIIAPGATVRIREEEKSGEREEL